MSQKSDEIDATFIGAAWSKPVKRVTSLSGSLFKSMLFPVRWLSHWDRDRGLSSFIRKWYFGNFS